MKKRTVLLGLAVGLVLALSLAVPALAFAAGQPSHGAAATRPGMTAWFAQSRSFVDADGDGICDNLGSGSGQNFVDANGDGICDNFVDADGDGICDNLGSGGGQNFVDANGDGICDNFTAGGGGGGRGQNFVDANGDGICDNFGTGAGGGRGMGRGNR
ncbi:MAG: hypothetical protein FWC59_00970 [Actinomycetia bacterium]|nr:hypothetical protein [Actinomycetes bacterium]